MCVTEGLRASGRDATRVSSRSAGRHRINRSFIANKCLFLQNTSIYNNMRFLGARRCPIVMKHAVVQSVHRAGFWNYENHSDNARYPSICHTFA